jgi:Fe-Mn family superoxide dismutase
LSYGVQDALEPYISKRTVELHWGKHQQDYVDSLNKQLATSMFYGYTLEELIKEAYNNGNPLPEYNNAAQVWNHHFFWESMQPEGGGSPGRGVLQQIEKDFGSFTNFREEFIRSALSLLGSGWVWLVCKFFIFIFFEVQPVQALLVQSDFLKCCFYNLNLVFKV